MEEMKEGVCRFHESEEKKMFYGRDNVRRVLHRSNFDLYESPAANWRDALFSVMGPPPLDSNELPSTCRFVHKLFETGESGFNGWVHQFIIFIFHIEFAET